MYCLLLPVSRCEKEKLLMKIIHHFNINNFCYDLEVAAREEKTPLKAKNNPLITPLFSYTRFLFASRRC